MAVLFLSFFASHGQSGLTGFSVSDGSVITSRFIEDPVFTPSTENQVTRLVAPRTSIPRGGKFIVYLDPPVDGGVYSRAYIYDKAGDLVQQVYFCGMSSKKQCTSPKRIVLSVSRTAYRPGDYNLVAKEWNERLITLPFTVY